MKRRISVFMILLAGVLILAHAIVPHHHHNKVLVAVVDVLGHEGHEGHEEHGHGHDHGDAPLHDVAGHHHHDASEDCLMNEAVSAATLKIQTDNDNGQVDQSRLMPDDGQLLLYVTLGLYHSPLATFVDDDVRDFRLSPLLGGNRLWLLLQEAYGQNPAGVSGKQVNCDFMAFRASPQHSSSKLGSAFGLHLNCDLAR